MPTATNPATAIPDDHHAEPARFLRIQEVADEIGLTTRAIRYYEEQGLLQPVARSEGSYRLYDPDDLERLRFIKGLRDDAGFSLAEIRQLLEDEAARRAVRDRYRTTEDPAERTLFETIKTTYALVLEPEQHAMIKQLRLMPTISLAERKELIDNIENAVGRNLEEDVEF